MVQLKVVVSSCLSLLMTMNGSALALLGLGMRGGARHHLASAGGSTGSQARRLCLAMASSPSLPDYDFSEKSKRFTSCFTDASDDVTPVTLLDAVNFKKWFDGLTPGAQKWLQDIGQDEHKPGRTLSIPGGVGETGLASIAFCLEDKSNSPWQLCSLRAALPKGTYKLVDAEGSPDVTDPTSASISWALSTYKFDRYMRKAENISEKQLIWPVGASKKEVDAIATSTFLVRDLISTPAQDCGPHHLESVIRSMATEFGGSATVITGDALLEANYRQIHAVGRAAASDRAPRLLDLTWGDESHPKVTLVGKGVCFDTGGLNIKPSSGMLTMRKDMGGAAQTIGLARLIMATGVPVRLRLLVPAVENAISGDAFRPGDILTARNGKTSEIGNTDAEGRLVLADALVEASSEEPSLIVDCATLTGAARVALGTDVPVMFCNDDSIADDLMKTSAEVHDQVWRLPLWEGYRKMISSKFADLQNIGSGGYGGAITAALYLQEFVEAKEKGGKAPRWVHLDFMGFNSSGRPGRPDGGEAQGMRAIYALIKKMYGGQA